MRWTIHEPEYYEPKLGTIRTIIFFAFLPVTINKEVRWLERVSVEQRWTQNTYSTDAGDPHYDHDYTKNEWNNIRFVKDD